MERSEVFKAIKERGATQAVVRFSGGNDEGGADSVELYGPGPIGYGKSPAEHIASLQPYSVENGPDESLVDALIQPIEDRYAGFGGDFYVSGDLTWDAEAGTVTMDKSESEYVHSTEAL